MMSQPNHEKPELDGLLAEAANQLRETIVSDDLIARCRENAIAIQDRFEVESETRRASQSANALAQWLMPLAVAASILLIVNVAQTIARRPPADRKITALVTFADGQKKLFYTDRTVAPYFSSELSTQGEAR